MRKLLYGAAAALLLGGAALADPINPNDQTTGAPTKSVGPDTVISNPTTPPAGPAKPSDMAVKGTDTLPNAMADQSPANSLQGRITKVQPDQITVKAQGGQKQSFAIDDRSAILRDGQAVSASDLKKGDDVRVSYDLRGAKQVATTITATSKEAGKAGHHPSGSSIQRPVPGNAPSTGESTRPDKSLDDRSFDGNTPGTRYRKEAGDNPSDADSAGAAAPSGDQTNEQPK